MKLNGKQVKCARSYDELKTKHYQKIVAWEESQKDKELQDKDLFSLFNILTDSKFSSFANTEENRAMIWEAVRWYFETPMIVEQKPPILLHVGFKWVVFPNLLRIPKHTDELSVGQNIVLMQAIQKAKYKEEILSFATAVFLQPLYDHQPFSKDRALDLEKIILEMPITKIYPIGFFLLTHVERDGIRRLKTLSRTRNSLITKSGRWLQSWLTWMRLKNMNTTA